MITLARASALTATAVTAAAVVITLRTPEHGGAPMVPVYVAPAASQAASPASGPGPGGHDVVIASSAPPGRRHGHRPAGSRCAPP